MQEQATNTDTEIFIMRLEDQWEASIQSEQGGRVDKHRRFSSIIPLIFLQAFCKDHNEFIPDFPIRHVTIWPVLTRGDKAQSLLLDSNDGHPIVYDPIALSIAIHSWTQSTTINSVYKSPTANFDAACVTRTNGALGSPHIGTKDGI